MKYFLTIILLILILIENAESGIEQDSLNIAIKLKIAQDFLNSNYVKSLDIANHCLIEATKINNKTLLAQTYKIIGKCLHIKGELNNSFDKFMIAMKLAEKSKDNNLIADIYCDMAENSRANALYDNALTYLRKAMSILSNIDNPALKARIYNRYGAANTEALYNHIINIDSVTYYLQKSMDLCKKDSAILLKANNFNILFQYYSYNNKPDSAKMCIFKALEMSKIENNEYDMINILINLGKYEFEQNNINKAIKYSLDAFNLAEKNKITVYLVYSAQSLNQIYKSIGDCQNEKKYLELYFIYRYKLQDESKIMGLLEVQNKLELERRQNLIDAKDKELGFNRSIYFISGIFVLALITIFILWILFLRRTNRKQADNYKIISSQNHQLSELNAAKDKFFSIIAHDLIGPLGSLKDYFRQITVSYDNLMDEDLKSELQMASEITTNILDLLDKLLQWSKTQRGVLQINFEIFDLNMIVKNTLDILSLAAKAKNIEMVNNIQDSVEIRADINMIMTVIRNLVNNAIKFTGRGGKIELSLSRKDKESGFVEIIVSDNGVGMDDSTIKKLFKVEGNVKTLGTAGEKGTGLGLILCKEYMDKLGGNIRVESLINKGTKFILTLPKSNI